MADRQKAQLLFEEAQRISWNTKPPSVPYRAIELARAALAEDPAFIKAASLLANDLRRAKNYEESISMYKYALQRAREDQSGNHKQLRDLLRDLGRVLLLARQYEDAVTYLTESLEIDYSGSAAEYLAEAYNALGRHRDVINLYSHVEAMSDGNTMIDDAALHLGRAYKALGDTGKALAVFTAGLRFNPANDDIRGELNALTGGSKINEKGKWKEAMGPHEFEERVRQETLSPGVNGLGCVRCHQVTPLPICKNCENPAYRFGIDRDGMIGLFCSQCKQGFTSWKCVCGTVNPINSKTLLVAVDGKDKTHLIDRLWKILPRSVRLSTGYASPQSEETKNHSAAAQDILRDVAKKSSSVTTQLWDTYGDMITSTVLPVANEIAKHGKRQIADDEKYKTHVDRLWKMLPLPVRLLGRKRLRWDAFLFDLRDTIFLIEGEDVRVHPNAKEQVAVAFSSIQGRHTSSGRPLEDGEDARVKVHPQRIEASPVQATERTATAASGQRETDLMGQERKQAFNALSTSSVTIRSCKQCDRSYEDDEQYCPSCGTTLDTGSASELICSNCGATNRSDFRFCKQCGSTIGEVAKLAEAAPTQDTLLTGKHLEAANTIASSPTARAANHVAELQTERVVAPEAKVPLESPQPIEPRPETATKGVEKASDVVTSTQPMARPQETTASKSAPAELGTKATPEPETTIVGITTKVTARPIHEKTAQTTLGAAATVAKPEIIVANQEAKVGTQPNLERQPGSVKRSSRSWLWPAVAGVVLLLGGGAGYLYYTGFLGKNPVKLQMILDAEVKAQGLDNIHVEVSKDWVVTLSGFVENEADRGRVLGIVESSNDVKGVEDRITVASTKGGSAKGVTKSPNAQSPSTWTGEDSSAKTETAPPSTQQPPSMRNLEEAIKRGTFE